MQTCATNAVWLKTKVQCLVRHAVSDVYYARTRVGGKLIWRSLKTTSFSVARAKLPKTLARLGGGSHARARIESAIGTVADAARVHLEAIDRRVDIKATTKLYWAQVSKSLFASWPGLANKKLGSITEEQCQAWASRYAEAVSDNRYNNAVDFLRALFELGIKAGVTFHNPASELGKKTPRPKRLELPSRDQFAALVRAMRAAGGRFSQQSADLVEFLAYSGTRIDEARHIRWSDVDLDGGTIRIHGPETWTKNSESRSVPIISAMRTLLAELRADPHPVDNGRGEFVLAVREAQKAIDRACSLVGCPRITHHDLRHLFATVCIENTVDVPTVARWLGHKDGGTLALKTYGHLRDGHSLTAAKKVQF